MILSIIALLITVVNVIWYSSLPVNATDALHHLAIINQVIASVLALIGVATYQGRRWRPNYQIGKPPIWPIGRAFNIVTLIAALGAILLTAQRFLGW